MKSKIVLLAGLFLSLSLWSCSDDDDHKVKVPESIATALVEKYPEAQKVEWETKHEYYVAEFSKDRREVSVWFDRVAGSWVMTETDITFDALPLAIQKDFQAGAYKTWRVDDVDQVERVGFDTVYILEVELGKEEVDLYYSADGVLIKAIKENQGNNNTPQNLASEIVDFINQNYPEARIVEVDREVKTIEVDIIYQQIAQEVVFDLDNNWLYTSKEVAVRQLPAVVKEVVNRSAYQGYSIDEAHYIVTKEQEYYLVELEKGELELYLKIDNEGNVIKD